ncbi:MAG TPA: GNAT family N-acetyltransferase [Candidatus Nanoarchaeia archaeon]|nr:GNAT family N-acetyltransferase [Candidatus Nanoarchaeia archaeon]
MRLEQILDTESSEFKSVWEIYESSFPSDERRDINQQTELLKNPLYKFFAAYDNGSIVGIIGTWQIDDFVFIEHFAIKEGLRGAGLGTALLNAFIPTKKIVLETERPVTDTAKRRIAFYERLGFRLNTYDYTQPAYSSDKKPVPMFLMSYPESLSVSEFTEIRRSLHTQVYCLEKPLI